MTRPKLATGLAKFIDPAYPITKTLADVFLIEKKSQAITTGRHSRSTDVRTNIARSDWRSEIISGKLCDDVFKLIASTLEKYRGCTIIDINPGACVWSSKLHDYLKPECHLLMEPDETYYEPFIKPLLEGRDSKYKHVALSGAHPQAYWANHAHILDEPGLLPPRPALEQDDPKLREIDHRLLVVGNLWRHDGAFIRRHKVFTAPLILQHMSYAGLDNTVFNRSGLVRMLWWLPDDLMPQIMTATTQNRKPIQAELDQGAEMVQLVGVSSIESQVEARSPGPLRPAGLQYTAKKHQATDQDYVDRERLNPNNVILTEQDLSGPNPLLTTCSSHKELRQLVKDFGKNDFDTIVKGRNKMSVAEVAASSARLSYPQVAAAVEGAPWRYLPWLGLGSAGRVPKIELALDIQMQYVHIEAELAALAEQDPDHASLQETTRLVEELGTQLDAAFDKQLAVQMRQWIDRTLEHLIAAYADPRPLSRDNRPFEPLKASCNEFWPRHDMSLIMMTPKSADLSVPGLATRREGAQTCRSLLKHLFMFDASPLPAALDRLAPNAATDLIAQVPAIRDVRKGGRLNPMKVIVRTMPAETLSELIKAYLEWPFRPTDLQLVLATEDASGVPAGEERDEDEISNEEDL